MNATLLATAEHQGWDTARAEEVLLDNRALTAEQFRPGVVAALRSAAAGHDAATGTTLLEVAEILDRWDGRYDLDSRGAVVWRELMGSFSEDEVRTGVGYAHTTWTIDDPVNTPNGVTGDVDGLAHRVLAAVDALAEVGIAADAALGDVQFIERGGRRIPLHGANEVEGIVNVVAPVGAMSRSDLEPSAVEYHPVPGRHERTGLCVEGYPITYGASFLMVVGFDDDGPSARGLLAYGQSGDPDSIHHVDQVDAFSRKELRPLLFRREQIDADPDLTVESVRG